jgi:ABC-type polysaccharide/polyol phosphate transport system ATPase subunit
MITLQNLTKVFRLHGRTKIVADNINATFPSGVSVGLLGRNGAGKSTLLKLIAGTTHPTSGKILSQGSVSFPVGLASALHGDMTGAQNTRFVARIYGADTDALMHYVEEFAELDEHFHLPVRSYSSGMRGRLTFGINMGLKFDTYLVDEITAVGDAAFKKRSRDVFLDRMKDSGAIFVSHSLGTVREMCTAGAYLENGKLEYFDDVEEAIERYMSSVDNSTTHHMPGQKQAGERIPFPYDARMLFGLGLPQTRIDWVSDCLRRHRACHFGKTREPHYFDTRNGILPVIAHRRLKTTQQLATRMQTEAGETQRNTLRLLREVSDLAAIHSAPEDGPDRHKAYLDYILTGRKTQPVVCDITPSYCLLGADTLKEMAGIGWARFVCVLRDPADRLWAQIWDSLPKQTRTLEDARDIAEQLIRSPERLIAYPEADCGRLFRALEELDAPDRICWLFHEELGTRESLRQLCDFLDIPNVPTVSMPPLPEQAEPEMPPAVSAALRAALAPQYKAARTKFDTRLPEEWSREQKQ